MVDSSTENTHLEAILNTVLDGIITIDNKGIVQSFNPAAVNIFGYTPEEVIGKNVKMLMPDPYHTEHDQYISNYLETGDKKAIGLGREVSAQRKDGSVFPMELGISEMSIDGKRMFVGIIRDISERKLYIDELQSTTSFLNSVLENAVDGIITIDQYGNIQSINQAGEKIFGFTNKELLGKNIKKLMPSPYHEEHDGYLFNYLNTGKKKIIGIGREVIGLRKDGSTFPMELSVSEIEIGEQRGFAGIVRDITERKLNEEILQKRTQALERSNEELERFAYIASHDLQEPLRMVGSYTNLLERRYSDKLDDDAKEFIFYANDGAKRMQVLIQDLLAFSRVGTKGEKFIEVDCDVLIKSIFHDLKSSIIEKNCELTHDFLPTVLADKTQMRQLLQNLINNAIKYSDHERQNKIHVSAKKTATHWQFSVSDTGIGIEECYFKKIFDIFSRLHNKQEYSGTGIGLAICKKIVERHGGKIWLESIPDTGSIFHFTIKI